jgi:putative peptide-modifying radical SAM enzyme
LDDLVRFLKKDADVVINFYGGEPLLRPDIVREVMDRTDARFVIQTNGLLFEDLGPEYIRRFHTILLSLDGGKEITDAHRGPGVYEKVTKAGRYIRECGFKGDLVARMTVSTDADIHRDCMHLAYMGMFDHIHWQLDFEMFWEGGADASEVGDWMEHSYNPGITKLIDQWVVQLFRQLDMGFVPFIVLARALMFGGAKGLWCGSGLDFWGITTDGRLTACPVNLEGEGLMAGDIFTADPKDLLGARPVEGPCPDCDIYGFCGGRCLLINRNRGTVSRESWDLMCGSVRHLKRELEAVLPDILDLYEKDSFVRAVFEYPEFNNSTEIMP